MDEYPFPSYDESESDESACTETVSSGDNDDETEDDTAKDEGQGQVLPHEVEDFAATLIESVADDECAHRHEGTTAIETVKEPLTAVESEVSAPKEEPIEASACVTAVIVQETAVGPLSEITATEGECNPSVQENNEQEDEESTAETESTEEDATMSAEGAENMGEYDFNEQEIAGISTGTESTEGDESGGHNTERKDAEGEFNQERGAREESQTISDTSNATECSEDSASKREEKDAEKTVEHESKQEAEVGVVEGEVTSESIGEEDDSLESWSA